MASHFPRLPQRKPRSCIPPTSVWVLGVAALTTQFGCALAMLGEYPLSAQLEHPAVCDALFATIAEAGMGSGECQNYGYGIVGVFARLETPVYPSRNFTAGFQVNDDSITVSVEKIDLDSVPAETKQALLADLALIGQALVEDALVRVANPNGHEMVASLKGRLATIEPMREAKQMKDLDLAAREGYIHEQIAYIDSPVPKEQARELCETLWATCQAQSYKVSGGCLPVNADVSWSIVVEIPHAKGTNVMISVAFADDKILSNLAGKLVQEAWNPQSVNAFKADVETIWNQIWSDATTRLSQPRVVAPMVASAPPTPLSSPSPQANAVTLKFAELLPPEELRGLKLSKMAVPAMGGSGETELRKGLSEICLSAASGRRGLSVVGASDIEAMLGFEKQKDLLGCTDDVSCLAEIGGALGVDAILTTRLNRVGKTNILSVTLIDIQAAQALVRGIAKSSGNPDQLIEAAESLVSGVLLRVGR